MSVLKVTFPKLVDYLWIYGRMYKEKKPHAMPFIDIAFGFILPLILR